MVAVHFAKPRAPISSTEYNKVETLCGMRGSLERGWQWEFTTLDGRETRHEFTRDRSQATCKRCLRGLAKIDGAAQNPA
jgi:hypothetical protein